MIQTALKQISLLVFFISCFGPLPEARATELVILPKPGTMVALSPAYQPAIIKGVTVHQDNPFLFDFIVDIGQEKLHGQALKDEGQKLIKYFLASLAIPGKDLWVNLSPYEKDRIVPNALGQTDMGRDLLAQDYILKQITASLIYPESGLGKRFWESIYSKSQELYGKDVKIPQNIFNKVWIMADKAEVFEHNQSAFVVDCHLKVMLEEDYLATQKNKRAGDAKAEPLTARSPDVSSRDEDGRGAAAAGPSHATASQVIRDIILPELEREVNTGKNFANLRQICNSIILASWYKKNLKKALLNQVYSDQSRISGIEIKDKNVKEEIYQQYLKAYKKGVFNLVKDANAPNGKVQVQKYFSGGFIPGSAVNFSMVSSPGVTRGKSAMKLSVRLIPGDPAMNVASFKQISEEALDAAERRIRKHRDFLISYELIRDLGAALGRSDSGFYLYDQNKQPDGQKIPLEQYGRPSPNSNATIQIGYFVGGWYFFTYEDFVMLFADILDESPETARRLFIVLNAQLSKGRILGSFAGFDPIENGREDFEIEDGYLAKIKVIDTKMKDAFEKLFFDGRTTIKTFTIQIAQSRDEINQYRLAFPRADRYPNPYPQEVIVQSLQGGEVKLSRSDFLVFFVDLLLKDQEQAEGIFKSIINQAKPDDYFVYKQHLAEEMAKLNKSLTKTGIARLERLVLRVMRQRGIPDAIDYQAFIRKIEGSFSPEISKERLIAHARDIIRDLGNIDQPFEARERGKLRDKLTDVLEILYTLNKSISPAMNASDYGGLSLDASRTQLTVKKEGLGVQMTIDKAMSQHIKLEDIGNLSPHIYQIMPIENLQTAIDF